MHFAVFKARETCLVTAIYCFIFVEQNLKTEASVFFPDSPRPIYLKKIYIKGVLTAKTRPVTALYVET